MAVHNPASRNTESGDESAVADESETAGAGMAHPTVVPTNFEPADTDREA
ncbi:hypothetical protein [Salinadaptatus halalkaliphilus]|nr:hypothetical protein [Salinadaptatus halalkaliphilus]